MMSFLSLLALPAVASTPHTPEALIAEARRRARLGDTEGVRIVATQALEIDGDHQRTAQYLVALSLDLDGEPEEALVLYDALVDAWPRSQVPADLAVRRASCLAVLGRTPEAQRQLRALPPLRSLEPSDRVKVEVLRATWDLEAARERRGLRRLDRVLTSGDPSTNPWWQAQARALLIERALTQASTLDLTGTDGTVQLEQRAQLLALAQQQVVEIIRLDQTRFALTGLESLAGAHAALGYDLVDSDVGGPGVEVVWVRAVQLYDRAEQLAARKAWTGAPVEQISQARRDLEQALDEL